MLHRIFELMDAAGINQTQMAKYIGVSQGNIGDWKSGRSSPKSDALVKIADFFGVSTDYLLGRTDSMAAPARSAEDPTLTTLLGYYDRFNQEGREKLVAYAADLQEKYTKAPAPISLKAAARDGGVKPVPAEAADSTTKKMVTSSDETL